MKVSEVIEAVQTYGEPELAALLDGLGGALAVAPLDALLRLADAVAKLVESKTELAAMHEVVAAAVAAADAAEAAALATKP